MAERPPRSRRRFIGIALAISSHFDDPLAMSSTLRA